MFYLMLGSLGDGSLELHALELLSERNGLFALELGRFRLCTQYTTDKHFVTGLERHCYKCWCLFIHFNIMKVKGLKIIHAPVYGLVGNLT